jgi:hypothetical protein
VRERQVNVIERVLLRTPLNETHSRYRRECLIDSALNVLVKNRGLVDETLNAANPSRVLC